MPHPEHLLEILGRGRRIARHFHQTLSRTFPHRPGFRLLLSGDGAQGATLRSERVVRPGANRRRLPAWAWGALLAGLVVLLIAHEVRTSAIQAWLFSRWAARLTYTLEPGPSQRIVFPKGGPLDERLGYTRIPEFANRLEARGFRVTAQARVSPAAANLARWGILPPYRGPAQAGLVLQGTGGARLFDHASAHETFRDPGQIPPLVVRTLLFIENRQLQEMADPRQNPVVDWPRVGKAGAYYAGRKLGLPLPLEGGSTLATQLEKFEHSPGGITPSPLEKLRQMTAASLKVYQGGTDTRAARQTILFQYLEEMPLAAAPGWGEVNGLGDGLRAWFGLDPAAMMAALASPAPTLATARAYKSVLALLCAAQAPTHFLVRDRAALEARAARYTKLLEQARVIDPALARRIQSMPLTFGHRTVHLPAGLVLQHKAITQLRVRLGDLLGEPSLYDLDRLHLEADSTLDWGLQEQVATLLDQLGDPAFLRARGLIGKDLLGGGDPRDVVYSVLLLERTPQGYLVRVHTDTLDGPFDVNTGMKMELGSTAKLRTLAEYLEVMAGLYADLAPLDGGAHAKRAAAARDPLTRWAAETLQHQPGVGLEAFLALALDRTYSGSPAETFFTGGGLQTYANFERDENYHRYSVRDGLIFSVNLVYVRLMRDLVRYQVARLPYDAEKVLADPDDPVRHRLLEQIAQAETTAVLAGAFHAYRSLAPQEMEARLLGRHTRDLRHLAMLFYAWHTGAGEEELGRWLASRVGPVAPETIRALKRAYGNPRLTLADFGFLLDRRPLEVWCAGQLAQNPGLSWRELFARSEGPRRIASAWLFRTRNRHAQDLRLRVRIEQDAFARMTPAWRRLGFPFPHLVPSLATAIGSSSDRPDALAELMGIIQNDGVRLPRVEMQRLRFAAGTPYETILAHAPASGERVLPAAVARALRQVLAGVVTQGTARRMAGVFVDAAGAAIPVGGKTGSGDNRYKTFARGGGVIASRPVSRTGAFAFYIGDRYVGVITAAVAGKSAGNYEFTSALPVTLLKLMAPAIETHLRPTARPTASNRG